MSILDFFWCRERRIISLFENSKNRNSVDEPWNISSTDVLNSCDALKLSGYSVKLIWAGYGDNCNGTNPSETRNYFFIVFRELIFLAILQRSAMFFIIFSQFSIGRQTKCSNLQICQTQL